MDAMRLHDKGRIYLIDGMDLGLLERTGTYVIDEEELTLIETGPSPSVPYIKEGLSKLGFSLEQVKYIIVTHIHLDHAGGAGLLIQDCPNAKVVVHPKGARHLASPERLIAGAQAVYGDTFDGLFAPIIAVPEDRLLIKEDGETLEIGENCTLKFFHTPGHANHHFSIYDPVSNGMFTGDTVGVRYAQLAHEGFGFYLPSTSPNQFNPEAMHTAIQQMKDMKLDYIYYGHYGMTANVEQALTMVANWLDVFVKEAKAVYESGESHEVLAARLNELIRAALNAQQIPVDHPVYPIIELDTRVCSMGLLDYLQKQDK